MKLLDKSNLHWSFQQINIEYEHFADREHDESEAIDGNLLHGLAARHWQQPVPHEHEQQQRDEQLLPPCLPPPLRARLAVQARDAKQRETGADMDDRQRLRLARHRIGRGGFQ